MPANYRDSEVRALVEEYEELQGGKGTDGHRLRTLLTLVDIQRGMQRLTVKERQAVFLCGIANLTVRSGAEQLGISPMTMHRRYVFALSRLVNYLNGVK